MRNLGYLQHIAACGNALYTEHWATCNIKENYYFHQCFCLDLCNCIYYDALF